MQPLHFADSGFGLSYRLLEAGTFETLTTTGDKSDQLQLDATEFSMLLSAVSLAQSGKRRKPFALQETASIR